MLILSRVCAEFRNRAGETVFTIPPHRLLSFLEAPEEIREDPLFSLMLRDGSLEAVRSVEQKRALEADPAGAAREAKKPRAKAAEKQPAPEAAPAENPAEADPAADAAQANPAAAPAPADAAPAEPSAPAAAKRHKAAP